MEMSRLSEPSSPDACAPPPVSRSGASSPAVLTLSAKSPRPLGLKSSAMAPTASRMNVTISPGALAMALPTPMRSVG